MAYSAFGINYGTAAQIQSFRGDDAIPAQPIWAIDTNQLWVVNGTQGKYRIAMADDLSAYLTTANASATYLSKSDASNTYLGINAKAKTAGTADAVPWSGVSDKPQLIPGTGDAGKITTFETVVAATTADDNSARSMSLANGGTMSVSNGSANKSWIVVVALEGAATINFGSSWSWSGSAPTLGKGLVTLAWYGAFGVATFTKYGS